MRSIRFRTEYVLWPVIFLIAIVPAIFRDVERFGDSSDYVMMGSSIAYDADLLYSEEDLFRIQRMKPPETDFPAGMFLIRDDTGRLLVGGHSFYYSLAAAPFFRIFGIRGFQIFNSLLWFLIAVLFFVRLRPEVGVMRYSLILIGLLFTATYDYILWQTPATWLLAVSGLFLYFYEQKRFLIAGLFLGIAGASQYPLWFWGLVAFIDTVRRRIPPEDLLIILVTAVLAGIPQILYFRIVTGTWHVTWLDLGTSSRFLYFPFNFPGEALFDRTRHTIVFSRFARINHVNPLDILRALISPRFGLFWFYPFSAFAIVRMIREKSNWPPVIAFFAILFAFCTAGRLETHQVGLRYLNPIYPVLLFGFRGLYFDRLEKLTLIFALIFGLSFALFPGANSMEANSDKMTVPALIERLGM